MNKPLEEYRSYKEILDMDPMSLAATLEQMKIQVEMDIQTPDQASAAGELLQRIANNFSYVSSLLSFAKIMKRKLDREGKKQEYEDMIDKEAVVENTLKAIDVQYRSLSKCITLHMENSRDLRIMGG